MVCPGSVDTDMDQCCVQSFVLKGIREGFRVVPDHVIAFGPVSARQHRCETCGQVYELQKAPDQNVDGFTHYIWQPVKH